MKTIFRLTCLAIGLYFTALPAQAIEFKPYAGVGLGGVLIDAGLGSENAFAGYGILGADLHENYGIELRFGTTGNTLNTVMVPQGTVTEANGVPAIQPAIPTPATVGIDWFFSYLFKLQYPVNEGFTIYGLVGGTTLKSKFAFAVLGTGHSTKTTLSYGGGVDFKLSNQWVLGADAMIYANNADTDPGANFRGLDMWGLTATIKYKF